jgi:hypothetical protein
MEHLDFGFLGSSKNFKLDKTYIVSFQTFIVHLLDLGNKLIGEFSRINGVRPEFNLMSLLITIL